MDTAKVLVVALTPEAFSRTQPIALTMSAPPSALSFAFSTPCTFRRSCSHLSFQKRLRSRNWCHEPREDLSKASPLRFPSWCQINSDADGRSSDAPDNLPSSTTLLNIANPSTTSSNDQSAQPSVPPSSILGTVHDDSNPNCRRSKMLLTRRVFSWTLRRRIARQARTQTSFHRSSSPPPLGLDLPPPSIPPPPPVQTLLGQRVPADSSIESMLLPNEPVATFLFHRGYTPIIKRRRSGDPPSRYLRLSYALVEPFSPSASQCSNPRANGSLKGWYQTAARWNVLEADFRPPLILKPSNRVDSEGTSLRRWQPPSSSKESENSSTVASSNLSTSSVAAPSSDSSSPENSMNDLHTWDTDENIPISPLLKRSRWERSLGRSPRIIAIGDVHGCIDEVQQLLRLADFQPGDQIVFLGDLVAKGPDSAGVVQLAREIGARSVRGNHDFEVVRWWEARRTGNADSVVSVEHARIARTLGEAEHAWLMDCPWFIECTEMDHLFVHAGFIPGVKLTQQNPRLMMNMRSVLRDGTVTAKNVEHCEWAKLWKGPQTVVFGHDAVRGLQQHPFAKGIDTGCVYGGRLTALLLPENRLISVAAKRAYIQPKRYRFIS